LTWNSGKFVVYLNLVLNRHVLSSADKLYTTLDDTAVMCDRNYCQVTYVPCIYYSHLNSDIGVRCKNKQIIDIPRFARELHVRVLMSMAR
jgi:hypothetical protein